MNTADQIPTIDAEVARIDLEIQKHMKAKFKLEEELRRLHKSLDYRERILKELGAERSRVCTYKLFEDI